MQHELNHMKWLVKKLMDENVKVQVVDEQLFVYPSDTDHEELIQLLRQHKSELIAFIQQHSSML